MIERPCALSTTRAWAAVLALVIGCSQPAAPHREATLTTCAHALPCAADEPLPAVPDDASLHDRARAARSAFAEGDFESAYQLTRELYALTAHPTVVFNMATIAERMNRVDDAIEHYTRYLELAPCAPNRCQVLWTLRRLQGLHHPHPIPLSSQHAARSPLLR